MMGARLIVSQTSALEAWGIAESRVEGLVPATMELREMKPGNIMEALLAVQMLGVYSAAVLFLKAGPRPTGLTPAGADAPVARATQLLRLFNDELKLMDKFKTNQGGEGSLLNMLLYGSRERR